MNRAFLYGDGVFETIKVSNHRIVHLQAHYQRAKNALEVLGMRLEWSLEDFEKTILEESITSGANRRVRITFFRSTGGLYTPTKKSIEYHIQHNPFAFDTYPPQAKGLRVGLCPHLRIFADQFANIKTCSANLQVQASRYRLEQGFDELILLNHRDEVAEGCASNIFIYKNDQLFTPTLHSGCLDGIMRQQVINLAKENDIDIIKNVLHLHQLSEAEEVWMTNAIQGIRWVESIKNIKDGYQSTIASEFQSLLHQKILL